MEFTHPSIVRRLRREDGFTWSEFLLVVVFVVGLLAVAVMSVDGIRDDTRVSNCRDALRALKMATEQFHSANDSYPINKSVLVESGIVRSDEVEGWIIEFKAGATEPTYTATGDCA
ncbi:MAG: hypothetical protein KDB02_06595 [Acidimicrobiales bacterium]|nr:hypothetical protein [Acidimicrobiales bacterium]